MIVSVQNFFISSSLAIVVVAVFFFLKKWLSSSTSSAAPQQQKLLPQSPRKLPFIGNLHQLGSFPHRSLASLSKIHGGDGGLMMVHLGRVPVVVASSTEAARELLKNQDSTFAGRPKLSLADKMFYGSKDVAFSSYGDYWRQIRSISMTHLLSKKRVQSFRSVREELTSLMVERIMRQTTSSSSSVVNLSDALASLTNDVICRVVLGRRYSDQAGKNFHKLVSEFDQVVGASTLRDYFPWLGRVVDRLNGLDSKADRVFSGVDEFLNGLIEDHRRNRVRRGEEEEEVNLVDILLDLQTDKEHQENILQHDSFKAVILDMLDAGTETSSSALVWTISELVRNPTKMKALQNEVREVARNNNRIITEDDMHKLHYLKAVIKEALRLHPPGPLLLPHQSTEDAKLFGYHIPKGTQAMVNAWAIGRDPKTWENPESFCPERFLGSDVDYRGHHFELIPFGAGRRMCPGMVFAEHVVELALAKLVNEFDFSMPDGERPEDLDMTERIGLTVSKKTPLLVVVATPHRTAF